MATMLRFRHYGWDVVTASWTAGSSDGRRTVVCYAWDVSNGFYKVKSDIPFELFIDRISGGGLIDLGSAL